MDILHRYPRVSLSFLEIPRKYVRIVYLGDRKEFFTAEKDMWEVTKRITRERKRREIEPLMQHLVRLKQVDESEEGAEGFKHLLGDIERLIGRLDKMSDGLMRAEESAFFGAVIRMLK